MAVVWGAGAPAWHPEQPLLCEMCVVHTAGAVWGPLPGHWLMDLCFAGAALLAAFTCLPCRIGLYRSVCTVMRQGTGCRVWQDGTASAVCRCSVVCIVCFQ